MPAIPPITAMPRNSARRLISRGAFDTTTASRRSYAELGSRETEPAHHALIAILPWHHRYLAAAVGTLVVASAYWTHQLGLTLLPGWVALSVWAGHRQGAPTTLGTVLLLLAAYTAAVTLAFAAPAWRHGLDVTPSLAAASGHLRLLAAGDQSWLDVLWHGWLWPNAGIVGLALACAFRSAAGAPAAVFVLPLVATGIVSGALEHGGYSVGALPMLGLMVAHGRWRTAVWGTSVGCALVAQGWLAHGHLERWNAPASATEAQQRVPRLIAAVEGDEPPQRMVSTICAHIDLILERGGRVGWDLGFARHLEHFPRATPYATALSAAIESRYRTEHHAHDTWPLLLVSALR